MTTSRSTEFLNIQNIFLKLPHGHFMGDLHTSSMSLSFLYVSVHSADLLGNTSEPAFRWIALLLSLQTRRLAEGSSIAPAPYSKEQEEIRETSPFFLIIFWGWVGGFKLVVFLSEEATNSTPIQPLPIPFACASTCDHFGWTWQSGDLYNCISQRDTRTPQKTMMWRVSV